jgi:hypothetical protein
MLGKHSRDVGILSIAERDTLESIGFGEAQRDSQCRYFTASDGRPPEYVSDPGRVSRSISGIDSPNALLSHRY